MNEEQFRKRLRSALGEPPPSDLRRRLEASMTIRPSRSPSFSLGQLAATVALLIVAGFVFWRLIDRQATSPGAIKPSTAVTTAAAVDPLNCRLPVVVRQQSGPPSQFSSEPGFIDTRTGQYVKDAAGSIAGLPGGVFEGTNVKASLAASPAWYSQPAKRWLPVGGKQVAPDGHSYLWVRLLPDGSNHSNFTQSELHRYDLTAAIDQVLWTYPGSIMVIRWDASGALADTVPPTGGLQIRWLIDPRTGVARRQPPENGPGGPTMLPGDQRNGSFSYGSFGADAQGHTIYRIGSRQAGDQEWIFSESAPGERVTIYKGTQGDATGFDPFHALGDGTGIWFSDNSTPVIWHWANRSGLQKISVKGLPGPLPGPSSATYVNPAGPCM